MQDDIVERLRAWSDMFRGGYAQKLTREAAAEIERLRTELASEQQWVQYLNDRLADFEQAPDDCS